jgi:raffinose/stachyose/melibiose transport system substrate-binding protein
MDRRFRTWVQVGFTAVFLCGLVAAGFALPGGEKPAAKPVTITVGASQNWITEADRAIAADFQKETGITVDFQVNPDSQYYDIIQTKVNTGEAPDVIMAHAGLTLLRFPPGTFLDLSAEPWAARLKEWARAGASVNGKLVALNTWSVDGWAVQYDPALFTRLGIAVPRTYDDLLKACAALSAAGITPIYEWPIDLWHTPLWLNAITADANINHPGLYEKLNRNETKFADVPEFVTCLTQLKELADKGYFGPTYMTDTWQHAIEATGTGKYAMALVYTSFQSEVASAYPDSNAKNFRMFPSPLGAVGATQAFATSAGGVVQAVNAKSKNIDAVKKWFAFRARKDELVKYYDASPTLAAPSFPEVADKPLTNLASITESVKGKFGLDGESGVLYFDKEAIGPAFQSLFLGRMTPVQVLQEWDRHRAQVGKAAGTTGF